MITDDKIELLSVSEASKVTGLARSTISAAMDGWASTRGRQGLRFVQPSTRRLVRRSALLEWFTGMERIAAHG